MDVVAKRTNEPDVAGQLAAIAAAEAVPGQRRCPGCRAAMGVTRFREIEVDVCSPCGAVFLDPGEVRLLATSQAPAPQPPPRDPLGVTAASQAGTPLLDTRNDDRELEMIGDFLRWVARGGRGSWFF